MTPVDLYFICVVLYAIIWPIVGWIVVRDKKEPTSIKVSDVLWAIIWGLCPLANTLGVIFGLGIIVASVKDIVLFNARQQ